MNELNEIESEPFERSEDEWKEISRKQWEGTNAKQRKELERLFAAYEENKSSHALNGLSKWILETLQDGVPRKYYEVEVANPEDAAAERISDVMEKIASRLNDRFYKNVDHLHGHIGTYIKQSHFKALAQIKKDSQLTGLTITDEDGEEQDTNTLKKKVGEVLTPSSDPQWAAEAAIKTAVGARRNKLHVGKRKPCNYLTRENAFLLRYLPSTDREFFMTLRQHSWDLETVQTELRLSESALDKRISRVGSKMEDLRNLLTAFKVPLNPYEHRFDLAQRFANLVRRLEGMRGSQLPTTFEALRIVCADRTPCTTTTVRTHALIVVRHILRLWRQHTALQTVSATNPTH